MNLIGTLHLPSKSHTGRGSSLSWSEENRLLATTKTALHILALSETQFEYSESSQHLSTIKTPSKRVFSENLHVDSNVLLDWRSSESQTAPEEFLYACWSPLNCIANGGCIIAAITTSYRVLIYAPRDDTAAAAWHPVFDATENLFNMAKTIDDIECSSVTWIVFDKNQVGFAIAMKSGIVHIFKGDSLRSFDDLSRWDLYQTFQTHRYPVFLLPVIKQQKLSIISGHSDGTCVVQSGTHEPATIVCNSDGVRIEALAKINDFIVIVKATRLIVVESMVSFFFPFSHHLMHIPALYLNQCGRFMFIHLLDFAGVLQCIKFDVDARCFEKVKDSTLCFLFPCQHKQYLYGVSFSKNQLLFAQLVHDERHQQESFRNCAGEMSLDIFLCQGPLFQETLPGNTQKDLKIHQFYQEIGKDDHPLEYKMYDLCLWTKQYYTADTTKLASFLPFPQCFTVFSKYIPIPLENEIFKIRCDIIAQINNSPTTDRTLIGIVADWCLINSVKRHDLLNLAEELYLKIGTENATIAFCKGKIISKDAIDELLKLTDIGKREMCPICKSKVPFESDLSATCRLLSHRWSRCSVTLRIIDSPPFKICSCCGRKATSFVSQNDDILANLFRKCPFCWNLYYSS